jgi:hypothetical protein
LGLEPANGAHTFAGSPLPSVELLCCFVSDRGYR